MLCPVCATKHISSNLCLHQINFDDAVYLCENRDCSYPEGYDWVYVKRKWTDMNKNESTTFAESTIDDMDQLLNEILHTPEKPVDNFDFNEFEQLLMNESVGDASDKTVQINSILRELQLSVSGSDAADEEVIENCVQQQTATNSLSSDERIAHQMIISKEVNSSCTAEDLQKETASNYSNISKSDGLINENLMQQEKDKESISNSQTDECVDTKMTEESKLRRSNRIHHSNPKFFTDTNSSLPVKVESFKIPPELREKVLYTSQVLLKRKKILKTSNKVNVLGFDILNFLRSNSLR